MTPQVLVLGSINVDHVVRVERMPGPGETITGENVVEMLGGKGANQAVASARLGRVTRFVGAVGSDAAAERALTALTDNGVDIAQCRAVSGHTGSAMVIVDSSAENMIVVSPGANGAVDESFADAAHQLTREQDVLLMQLEVPIATVEAAARASVATVILNPAPAAPLSDELLSNIDILVLNESELFAVADGTGSDLRAAMRSLPVPRVVTTLGPRGCIVKDGEHWWSIRAPVVAAVDTTGAGDCFCGALADGLARSMSLETAARRATIAAAISTMSPGAQASPTAEQIAACGFVADLETL